MADLKFIIGNSLFSFVIYITNTLYRRVKYNCSLAIYFINVVVRNFWSESVNASSYAYICMYSSIT